MRIIFAVLLGVVAVVALVILPHFSTNEAGTDITVTVALLLAYIIGYVRGGLDETDRV